MGFSGERWRTKRQRQTSNTANVRDFPEVISPFSPPSPSRSASRLSVVSWFAGQTSEILKLKN